MQGFFLISPLNPVHTAIDVSESERVCRVSVIMAEEPDVIPSRQFARNGRILMAGETIFLGSRKFPLLSDAFPVSGDLSVMLPMVKINTFLIGE